MTMLRTLHPYTSSRLFVATMLATLLVFPACSMNVKKDSEGGDKRVDIETPVGELHVSKSADVRDIGLAVYPGARVKEKEEEGQEKSANVNISSNLFGLKVVAIEYQSDDSPDKLIAFYKDQLKKYGKVLECHTSSHGDSAHAKVEMGDSEDHESRELKCEGDNQGSRIELKVGTQDNQHLVSVEPRGKGADFALVYVRTRGGDTI